MNQLSKYYLITLLMLSSVVELYAQDISISGFFLTQYNKSILVNWTIESGSTCNGITIFRSSDSLVYENIGSIAGVCGSNSEPTHYNFTDSEPVRNKTNYYRLKFGNGQNSEIRSLHFTYVEPNNMIIRPNPAQDNITLELNKDQNNIFMIRIIGEDGNIAFSQQNIFGKAVSLDISHLRSGIYTLELIDEYDKKIRKKLVKL